MQKDPTRTASTTATTQADEALRRARSADRDAKRAIARRAGLMFLRGLNDLTRNLPHPNGPALRYAASHRNTKPRTTPAPAPAPTGKPRLRLVGGGQ